MCSLSNIPRPKHASSMLIFFLFSLVLSLQFLLSFLLPDPPVYLPHVFHMTSFHHLFSSPTLTPNYFSPPLPSIDVHGLPRFKSTTSSILVSIFSITPNTTEPRTCNLPTWSSSSSPLGHAARCWKLSTLFSVSKLIDPKLCSAKCLKINGKRNGLVHVRTLIQSDLTTCWYHDNNIKFKWLQLVSSFTFLSLQGFLLATAELILTFLCDSLSDAPDQASFEEERKEFVCL